MSTCACAGCGATIDLNTDLGFSHGGLHYCESCFMHLKDDQEEDQDDQT